ncbi:MAG: hypothetical protein ACI80F_001827, partial [Natronomonas sp.]|uniref:hypothetical protein n=2 Tax=Natronomonas sp. TaxID=2184060 RepID=UPI00398A39FB
LEGFRWNSRATQKLEAGQREHKNSSDAVDAIDDYQDLESIMEDESSKMAIDASSESDFYDEYYKSRFTETDYFQCKTNPLKVAAGRPVCYRIADSIGEAVDNPSFNTQEYVDYQKAIILQVFIGTNPYSFATSSYSLSPDEAINRWFLESQGEINGVGNCQDGTYLYCGVAAHLLDANVARIHVSANGILHVTAGAFDLRMPDSPFEIWADDHPAPTATRAHTKSTEYGELSLIECIYPDPTIGWKLNGSSEMKISTYLTNANIQSHIPLNDDYEPDQNGSVRTEADDPEIPWEFHENHNTISDVVDL